MRLDAAARRAVAAALARGDAVVTGRPARPDPPPRDEAEEAFTARLIALAHSLGYLAYHAVPLRMAKGWRTGTQGDPGFPDIVLARAGETVLAELKAEGGRVRADQDRWVRESGAAVWKPKDWDLIVATLEGGA